MNREIRRGRDEMVEHQKKDRRIRAAILVSVMLHAGGIFHKEIAQEIEDLPRTARAISASKEHTESLNVLLKNVGELLESGEVLSLNLSEFHLEQERLSGGVDDEKIEQAKTRYESIINKANAIKRSGAEFNEVMEYVLVKKGEYVENRSFLSDLLTDGGGNCEAREKFISSAIQDTYPDLVAEGRVKVQVFKAYTDQITKKTVPGHVRVILEDPESEMVAVLEGDSVTYTEKKEIEDVPAYEITKLAVQSALAAEGMYTFKQKEDGGGENGGEEELSMDRFTEVSAWDSLRFLGSNSVSAFPKSDAVYSPTPLGGGGGEGFVSSSSTPETQKRMDVLQVEFLREVDPEHIEKIRKKDGMITVYPFHEYTNVDDQAIHAAVEYETSETDHDPVKFVFHAEQVPSQELLDVMDASIRHTIEIVGNDGLSTWEGLILPSVAFSNADHIPDIPPNISWRPDASITISFSEDAADLYLVSTESLPFLQTPVSSYEFLSYEMKLIDTQDGIFSNMQDKSMDFYHVLPTSFKGAHIGRLEVSAQDDLGHVPGLFEGAEIDTFILYVRNRVISNKERLRIENTLWSSREESPEAVIHSFGLSADMLAESAFRGVLIDMIDISVTAVEPGALNDADIEWLSISAHTRGIGKALSGETNIGTVEVQYETRATVTNEDREEIRRFCVSLEERKIPYTIKVSDRQNGLRFTLEDMEEIWKASKQ